ncbi:MAG: lysophospholipid acyltransferase family protein [Candidatus Latescibacteria bacterium]|nr:lysophospholipid acyltransferase family protein [Candidatus Latescibacterota bacterium]
MASWRETRQWLEHAAVRGALSLAGRIPLEAGQRIGAAIGCLGFDLVRARRDVSIENIMTSLGVSRGAATKIARAAYANSGRCLMEFAAFAHLTRAEVLDLVAVEGFENVERVRAEGKGCIIVAAHLGHWEMIGAVMVAMGVPIHFLVGQQTNARVDDVMNDLRRKQGIGIITRSVALRKVLQALTERQFVAMLPDQDARKGGVMVDFLGRPASTVRGPALFAIRRNCAILPVFMSRTGSRHLMTVEEPLYPRPLENEDDVVRDLTQRYTDRITARVRMHPDEYFWPHRRWKTKAAQEAQPHSVAGIS